jgi:catechol 2,3-dioxygenase-like lactoylglutathione lyase family enzyme
MKMFSGWVTVAVNNMDAAARWYAEKFDLKNEGLTQNEDSDLYVVASRDMATKFLLVSRERDGEPDRAILNTGNAASAREWLLARGVNAGPVETDRQGTHYFEMRDLEDNVVEICEEPG